MYTICVLLYGNYPDLAKRCLDSILSISKLDSVKLRLGLNEISDATREYVNQYSKLVSIDHIVEVTSEGRKYPTMRKMFYDKEITTPYVMWFDDDSYLRDPSNSEHWLTRVNSMMKTSDMIGSIYGQDLYANQKYWIESQPWFAGKTLLCNHRVRFATGGWWCCRAEILQKYSWPPADIIHRGGDVMFGELFRQQGLKLSKFNDGVAINSDDKGIESKAKRRGFDSKPVGYNYIRSK